MLRPQNCCLIKPTVFVSFLQLLKPPLHFPASRGLSLRGKNVRKEREVSLLSLIFASSWETSASREPLHMRYLIFDMNGWTLPKNPTTVQRQPLQLVYKIESLLIETILCSLLLKIKICLLLPLTASFTGWLQKMIEGRKGRRSVKIRLLHWQTPFVTVTLTVRSLITVAPRSLYHSPTRSLKQDSDTSGLETTWVSSSSCIGLGE